MIVEFECPTCKGHLCERWGLHGSNLGIRAMYWHMILNPGLAFNELVLGQRSPEELFVCRSCALPLVERSYVHCPSCGTFHDCRIWGKGQAFGNWFGYFCPSCGGRIPCLWNFTSRLVLALTLPFWWLPVKAARRKMMESQRQRIAKAKDNYVAQGPRTITTATYWKMGLLWGAFMDVFFAAATVCMAVNQGLPLEEALNVFLAAAAKGALMWGPGGVLFGLFLKLTLHKSGNRDLHLQINSDGTVPAIEAERVSSPDC